MAGKIWSLEEREYLMDVWGEISVKKIARHLRRSEAAVISFVERNHLGGAMINTGIYLTTGEAAELIGSYSKQVRNWIESKELKAKKHTLRKRKMYRIDPENFKEFLKDNTQKWDANKLKFGFLNENEKWLIDKRAKDAKTPTTTRSNFWTLKEEQTLMKLVDEGYSNLEIAKILNRTKISVTRKRTRLTKEKTNEFARALYRKSA